MTKNLEHWQYPIGRYLPKFNFEKHEIEAAITTLKDFPEQLRSTLSAYSPEDLNAPYRPGGWKIKQLVHHIADSHCHAYMRCKYAYLENNPTIKAYRENDWAEKSPDALGCDIEASLKVIEGFHQRWTYFLEQLTTEELKREFSHPERKEHFTIAEMAYFYAWHARHHLAHIVNYKNFSS